MRCSAWSSLAISVCNALLFAGPAAAHVVATPSFVTDRSTSTLTFSVPNERSQSMTGLVVTVPDGLSIVGARSSGKWQAHASVRSVHWGGGRLAADAEATFALDVKAATRAGSVELAAVQIYPDRETVRWPISLTIVPGEKPSQNLGGALVAGILGLLLLTGLMVFIRQRRGRSLQEK